MSGYGRAVISRCFLIMMCSAPSSTALTNSAGVLTFWALVAMSVNTPSPECCYHTAEKLRMHSLLEHQCDKA